MADVLPLPAGSRLTAEPGGQLELSSARFDWLDAALTGTATDLFVLDQACAARRIELTALGADPLRPPRTGPRRPALRRDAVVLRRPRRGRSHDDVQHGVDPGERRPRQCGRGGDALAHRPRALPDPHRCFANSPLVGRSPQRLAVEPAPRVVDTRSDPLGAAVPRRRCGRALGRLHARRAVMLVRTDAERRVPMLQPLSFGRRWPTATSSVGRPRTISRTTSPRCSRRSARAAGRAADVRRPAHPVLEGRSRGHPRPARSGGRRRVADLVAHRGALDRHGPARPGSPGARALGAAALPASHSTCCAPRRGQRADRAVAGYRDRWVARGRAPADDVLDRWRRDGTLPRGASRRLPYIRELASEIDLR